MSKIINVCCALHNISMEENEVPNLDLDYGTVERFDNLLDVNAGKIVRDKIAAIF